MDRGVLTSPSKQIRQLLLVLFSAILCAAILAGGMLYFYGPTGRYLIDNVLLNPDMISKLSYDEMNSSAGRISHYTFDHIEYAYWSATEKNWKKVKVNPDVYRHFYEMIKNEMSIVEVSEEVVNEFSKATPSALTIYVKDQDSSSVDKPKPFQSIQFATNSEYYRVELREEATTAGWAYFQYSGIKDLVSSFIPQTGLQ